MDFVELAPLGVATLIIVILQIVLLARIGAAKKELLEALQKSSSGGGDKSRGQGRDNPRRRRPDRPRSEDRDSSSQRPNNRMSRAPLTLNDS